MELLSIVVDGKITSRQWKEYEKVRGLSSIQLSGALIEFIGEEEKNFDYKSFSKSFVTTNLSKHGGKDNLYPFIDLKYILKTTDKEKNLISLDLLKNITSDNNSINLDSLRELIKTYEFDSDERDISINIKKGRGEEALYGSRDVILENWGFLVAFFGDNGKQAFRYFRESLNKGDFIPLGADKSYGYGVEIKKMKIINENLLSIGKTGKEYKIALGDFIPLENCRYEGRLSKYKSIKGYEGYEFPIFPKGSIIHECQNNNLSYITGKELEEQNLIFNGKTITLKLYSNYQEGFI